MNNCPHCQSPIYAIEEVLECETCKTPHHAKCWNENNGCGSETCSSQDQQVEVEAVPQQNPQPQEVAPLSTPKTSDHSGKTKTTSATESYWLHRDGKRYGPYSEAALQKHLSSGNAGQDDHLQAVGSGEWTTLRKVLAQSGASQPTGNTGNSTRTAQTPREKFRKTRPNNHMVWAILTTICCCLPFGIPAIVYAAQVDKKFQQGDFQGAEKSSRTAKTWCLVAFGLGIAYVAAFVIFNLVTEGMNGGY